MAEKQKSVEYYLNLKYPVTTVPSEDGGYVAEIEVLPGCISQGDTLEETYENIEEARRLWIEIAFEDGQLIPEPRQEEEYSGKFFIRAPKSLHHKLDQEAKREGVSLNQYLVSTLSYAVGVKETKANYQRKRSIQS